MDGDKDVDVSGCLFFFFFLTFPKKPYSGNATMWGPTAKVEGVY